MLAFNLLSLMAMLAATSNWQKITRHEVNARKFASLLRRHLNARKAKVAVGHTLQAAGCRDKEPGPC